MIKAYDVLVQLSLHYILCKHDLVELIKYAWIVVMCMQSFMVFM